MQVIHPVCCGIDVHAAQLTACLRRVSDEGQITTEWVECGPTYRELGAFRTWLQDQQCPVVALESTGVYWQPVYHVRSEAVEVVLANSRDVRQRPGKKTDKSDATWMADLLAHGLITPSFVPPPQIRAFRDLTRTRVSLVQRRTQAKNRVYQMLEDTNIKLASVVSDVFGQSGRRRLDALVAGARDPAKLSARALGTLRRKMPQREVALEGQCPAHHARRIAGALELVDVLGRQIAAMDQQLQELLSEVAPQLEQLDSLPGVNEMTARAIIAEIGLDMRRFGSASRLSAWAGLSPGNNESAGKRRRGRTRKGNRYLRRVLVQWAWATRKTSTFLGRTFRRLEARFGSKKAAMAVAHKLLVIIYHLLLEGTFYEEERYDRLLPQQEERERKRAIKALERLGYSVTLDKVTSPAGVRHGIAVRGGL
jgi:transposase